MPRFPEQKRKETRRAEKGRYPLGASLAFRETFKHLQDQAKQEVTKEDKPSRYTSLLKKEDKELLKGLTEDNLLLDMREEIALMRLALMKSLKGEELPAGLSVTDLLTQLREITQAIERLQRVQEKYWSKTETKKAADRFFFLVDSTLTQCPYCKMPLTSLKTTLGEKLLSMLKEKKERDEG
jgi:hypothetical protein